MSPGYDVEFLSGGVLRVRTGETAVTATKGARGARPQVTVTHKGATVCTDRIDLADATARKKLLRKIGRGRLIVPEGMLVALASAVQAPFETAIAENPHAPYRRTDEGFWLLRTR